MSDASGPTPRSARPAVYKFGGAALADAAAVRHVAALVSAHVSGRARAGRRPRASLVVVASAARGVTDALLGAARAAVTGGVAAAAAPVGDVRARFEALTAALDGSALDGSALDGSALDGATPAEGSLAGALCTTLDAVAELVERLAAGAWDAPLADALVAHGERLTARCLVAALRAAGVAATYVEPERVVRADGRHGAATPDVAGTALTARAVLGPLLEEGAVPVVPGFVAAAPDGATVTLGRGGSDLTATLLAAALEAREVVLWKDVPGFLTADPDVVPDARVIPVLDADDAAELAYHGARVLQPRALAPLAHAVGGAGAATRAFVRPFADPAAPGTEIVWQDPRAADRSAPVRAVAVNTPQALVTVAGADVLGTVAVGTRALGALEQAGIPASLVSHASSAPTMCFAIAAADAAEAERALGVAFAAEVGRGEMEPPAVRAEVATLAVVGRGMAGAPGVAGRLFTAVGDAGVNVVAIAQGASERNISLVVDAADAVTAQRAVHAAFRLDKIGGGSAAVLRAGAPADVVVFGFGRVGQAVARQLAAGAGLGGPVPARLVAVVDRSGYVFDPRGLSARRVAALVAGKQAGRPLAELPRGVRAGGDAALGAIAAHALTRPVLVDVTAGDTGAVLGAAVRHGMDLVLANKRPLADDARAADALARAAAAGGRRVRHEATVGAGLPLLDTLDKLDETGDRVLGVEGCPSGTLGYLFGELGRGVPFSEALGQAMALGYTEPDPRDDLTGADVARKAVILARRLGWRGDPAAVRVTSLVPAPLSGVTREAFVERVVAGRALDARWARRVADARARGLVLRYRASASRRRVRVGLVAVPTGAALASLSGTDNQFSITTRRYRANPLVITGPGAGAEVTAAGVVNDVLKLATTR